MSNRNEIMIKVFESAMRSLHPQDTSIYSPFKVIDSYRDYVFEKDLETAKHRSQILDVLVRSRNQRDYSVILELAKKLELCYITSNSEKKVLMKDKVKIDPVAVKTNNNKIVIKKGSKPPERKKK